MEAPIPASALIHSATLVAAGIYLFFKFSFLIFFNYFFLKTILVISSFTFFFGSIVSSTQTDLKKILAYSTISNCGLIFTSLLVSNYLNTLIFFILHGWFKSISFLLIGFVVVSYNHLQDIRLVGNSKYLNFIQFSIVIITLMSLSSWLNMYNSIIKHTIIESLVLVLYVKILVSFSTIFTILYSIRIIFLINTSFFKFKKFKKHIDIYNIYNIYIYI